MRKTSLNRGHNSLNFVCFASFLWILDCRSKAHVAQSVE